MIRVITLLLQTRNAKSRFLQYQKEGCDMLLKRAVVLTGMFLVSLSSFASYLIIGTSTQGLHFVQPRQTVSDSDFTLSEISTSETLLESNTVMDVPSSSSLSCEKSAEKDSEKAQGVQSNTEMGVDEDDMTEDAKTVMIDEKIALENTVENTPVTSNPEDVSTVVLKHVVQKDECLSLIAAKYGCTVEQLLTVNTISDLNVIYTGRVIAIP